MGSLYAWITSLRINALEWTFLSERKEGHDQTGMQNHTKSHLKTAYSTMENMSFHVFLPNKKSQMWVTCKAMIPILKLIYQFYYKDILRSDHVCKI
jgi:hypothetical protein